MVDILLVEDNAAYRKNLKAILVGEGYHVDDVPDAITGVEYMGQRKYNLVISDLMMDVMDGNRFLSFVKKVSPETKTIILTGQPTPKTEIDAIDNRVDKYLTKGVRMEVLLKYVTHLLEVQKEQVGSRVQEVLQSEAEELVLELKGRKAMHKGEEVKVTTKEFGILYMLLSEKGKAIKREEFIKELWDNRFEEVDERVIDVHIKLLRKKLMLSSINTIRGYGYKWDE